MTVLKIVLSNEYGDERSINLPNPKSDITLASIREAMSDLLSNHYLMNRNLTNPMTAVKSATKTTTTSSTIS